MWKNEGRIGRLTDFLDDRFDNVDNSVKDTIQTLVFRAGLLHWGYLGSLATLGWWSPRGSHVDGCNVKTRAVVDVDKSTIGKHGGSRGEEAEGKGSKSGDGERAHDE